MSGKCLWPPMSDGQECEFVMLSDHRNRSLMLSGSWPEDMIAAERYVLEQAESQEHNTKAHSYPI